MKILLISGHGAGDTGACGCGYKEADLTRQATNILEGKLQAYGISVTRYPVARDAYQDNRNGALRVNFSSYDLIIEVHFNSFNGKAYGTETLYKPSNMYQLANKITSAIASIGFMNRGPKKRTDLANMNKCARLGVPYVLIETCFIDSKADMKLYHEKLYAVWDAVASAVAVYYGYKKLASAGQPAVQPKPAAKPKSEKIAEDGSWGQATTKLAQKVLGTTVDGIVSNQPLVNKKYLPNCSTYSWEFKLRDYGSGSSMVKALQRLVKTEADGYCGKQTIMCLQKFLGISVDGSCGPATVKAFQRYLNSKVK